MKSAKRDKPETLLADVLPISALDDRIAIVGTSGAGKTYAAKGMVERLLETGARVCVVDPLGVWWGLRASADGTAPGFPVIVFGGRHADVDLTEGMGAALGRVIATQPIASVIDLSELGSAAARRRFMSAFAEAIYEENEEPLHLVLDEADLWSPQRPMPDQNVLLGRIEEIVRRGRVRGFIPWLITQRPAVVHKDVLSQADVLIAMKLTSSQDRAAIGGWIEGQADREEGKRILAELPRLSRGEGWIWAPGLDVLSRAVFPAIATLDSSRTPKRGERAPVASTLASVDLSAISAALAEAAVVEADAPARKKGKLVAGDPGGDRRLAAAEARVAELQASNNELTRRLSQIVQLAAGSDASASPSCIVPKTSIAKVAKRPFLPADGELHPAARKLLVALAQHSPGRFTWGQTATLAGLKPSGGHFNAGRKHLRDAGLIDETSEGLIAASALGMAEAGEVPAAPSTPAERLSLWCARLPSPAPEMLRTLAGRGEAFTSTDDLAAVLGKKPTGGHWNSGVATLRNNGLVDMDGKAMRAAELLR